MKKLLLSLVGKKITIHLRSREVQEGQTVIDVDDNVLITSYGNYISLTEISHIGYITASYPLYLSSNTLVRTVLGLTGGKDGKDGKDGGDGKGGKDGKDGKGGKD